MDSKVREMGHRGWHGLRSTPGRHEPGRTCLWVGPGVPGIWDCEATASGCDAMVTTPPSPRAGPQGEAASRVGTEDTESGNTDPKVGAWPLHVRLGSRRHTHSEERVHSAVPRIRLSPSDCMKGLHAEFPKLGQGRGEKMMGRHRTVP